METLDLARAFHELQTRVIGWVEGLIAGLPNFVAAVLVLLMFWVAARVVRRVLRRLLGRITHYPDVNRVISGFAFTAVLITGLFVALGILQLDKTVTSLLAGAGIVGLALGFAFQDIAENFIAGIILSVRRQFTDGDIIESNGFMGTVERVNMRATLLRTFQGQRVMIPNKEVFQKPLTNYSGLGPRRVDIEIGVSYGDDLEQARRVATAAVEGLERRDRSLPIELFYEGFGDSSIHFSLRFWIPFQRQTDFLDARSEAVIAIKKAFDRDGITIPFPIRTVDFSPVGGVVLRDAWPRGG